MPKYIKLIVFNADSGYSKILSIWSENGNTGYISGSIIPQENTILDIPITKVW